MPVRVADRQRDGVPSGLPGNVGRASNAVPGSWDWVRAYVTHPPVNVTHGICETCIRQHYPDL